MKIGNWFKALEWTTVKFGEGELRRYVVFECKFLFSIYVNRWNVVEHDRFHCHAFPAISIFLRGWYYEEQLVDSGLFPGLPPGISVVIEHFYKAPRIRFISRTNNHRMMQSSKNAITITLAGPWDRMWSETDPGSLRTRVLTWGRKLVAQEPGAPGGK